MFRIISESVGRIVWLTILMLFSYLFVISSGLESSVYGGVSLAIMHTVSYGILPYRVDRELFFEGMPAYIAIIVWSVLLILKGVYQSSFHLSIDAFQQGFLSYILGSFLILLIHLVVCKSNIRVSV